MKLNWKKKANNISFFYRHFMKFSQRFLVFLVGTFRTKKNGKEKIMSWNWIFKFLFLWLREFYRPLVKLQAFIDHYAAAHWVRIIDRKILGFKNPSQKITCNTIVEHLEHWKVIISLKKMISVNKKYFLQCLTFVPVNKNQETRNGKLNQDRSRNNNNKQEYVQRHRYMIVTLSFTPTRFFRWLKC